jgi:hypothetical protein
MNRAEDYNSGKFIVVSEEDKKRFSNEIGKLFNFAIPTSADTTSDIATPPKVNIATSRIGTIFGMDKELSDSYLLYAGILIPQVYDTIKSRTFEELLSDIDAFINDVNEVNLYQHFTTSQLPINDVQPDDNAHQYGIMYSFSINNLQPDDKLIVKIIHSFYEIYAFIKNTEKASKLAKLGFYLHVNMPTLLFFANFTQQLNEYKVSQKHAQSTLVQKADYTAIERLFTKLLKERFIIKKHTLDTFESFFVKLCNRLRNCNSLKEYTNYLSEIKDDGTLSNDNSIEGLENELIKLKPISDFIERKLIERGSDSNKNELMMLKELYEEHIATKTRQLNILKYIQEQFELLGEGVNNTIATEGGTKKNKKKKKKTKKITEENNIGQIQIDNLDEVSVSHFENSISQPQETGEEAEIKQVPPQSGAEIVQDVLEELKELKEFGTTTEQDLEIHIDPKAEHELHQKRKQEESKQEESKQEERKTDSKRKKIEEYKIIGLGHFTPDLIRKFLTHPLGSKFGQSGFRTYKTLLPRVTKNANPLGFDYLELKDNPAKMRGAVFIDHNNYTIEVIKALKKNGSEGKMLQDNVENHWSMLQSKLKGMQTI